MAAIPRASEGQNSPGDPGNRPISSERYPFGGPERTGKTNLSDTPSKESQHIPRQGAIPVIPSFITSYDGPLSSGRENSGSDELRLQTSVGGQDISVAKELEFGDYTSTIDTGYQDYNHRANTFNEGIPVRASSVKSLAASQRSLSPSSVSSSPGVGPFAEITPLPSPLGSKSGSWIDLPPATLGSSPLSPHHHISPGSFAAGTSPPTRRKQYGSFGLGGHQDQSTPDLPRSRARSHSDRSSGEYLPVAPFVRVRNLPAPSAHAAPGLVDSGVLQREVYVAPQRGLATKSIPGSLPSPPKSHQSAIDSIKPEGASESQHRKVNSRGNEFEARGVRSELLQRWLPIRQLGVGTFSTVMLASSDTHAATKPEAKLDPKTLVAVKICEHGPAGGADEKRIESSLKRELEILKSIHHPSLVHLRAVNVLENRAFLVLDYSAGGDLFEFASLKQELLVPKLIRRMFAELSDAVSYLHANYIVHRDIKLENVLVNPPLQVLSKLDYATCPTPIVTLTDLGLGRTIPRPPETPLLSTRCGSEDYAAPEVLMGQEYDGRHTDAWALGVLLYALMEGRLPFDPIPGAKRQSPTPHRIARCEWRWMRWGDADGDWDGGLMNAASAANKEQLLQRGSELEDARLVVEGLLKRVSRRWPMSKVQESPWVKGGIQVDGGIHREMKEED